MNRRSIWIEFFSIPELCNQVASNLTRRELSQLMQTCSDFYRCISPCFHHTLNLAGIRDCLEANAYLRRNFSKIRRLFMDEGFLRNYSRGCLRYKEDPNHAYSVAPMINLFSLHFKGNPNIFHRPLIIQKEAGLQHMRLSWAIELSSRLTILSISGLLLSNRHEPGLLARTIGKLEYLNDLRLTLESDKWDSGAAILKVFHHLRRRIRRVRIGWNYRPVAYPNIFGLSDYEKEDAEDNRKPTPTDPFLNLGVLDISTEFIFETKDIQNILARCPNLTSMTLPRLQEYCERRDMAQAIVTYCPLLRNISQQYVLHDEGGSLIGAVLEKSGHYLNRLSFQSYSDNDTRLWRMLAPHVDNLVIVSFVDCRGLDYQAILILLQECRQLELLEVDGPRECLKKISIPLEETTKRPWVARKLRVLSLTINLGHIESLQHAVFVTPNEFSMPFSQALARRRKLEEFYRQLGSLVHLTSLSLRVVPLPEGEGLYTFPGLLCLGPPGYLRELSRLTKIRFLGGSLNLYLDHMGMSQRDYGWIYRQWGIARH
ncbi:hypothetical protein FBU30_002954 [Linnemannia zychae]|nr:hypothetical protein FBU30_002954 [Linnemannia zychae]